MKILIVEDEPSLREIMVRTLTREQYVVEQAADYAAALDKIAAYDYDCILLDIMLPGGSGLRLLEELKRRRSPAAVIIISARASLDDKIEGLELGADDYLPKPFHLAELSARIRSVLRRHQRGGYESLDAGNVRLWPDSRRVEVAAAKWSCCARSTTSSTTSCPAPTTRSTRPRWPKGSGATISTRPTISISSMRR